MKRYVREGGSEEAQNLLRKYRFISSVITPVEASTPFGRRKDSGDLAVRHLDATLKRSDSDRRTCELTETAQEVSDQAERLGREKSVRALHAIHMPSPDSLREATGQQ